VRARTEAGLFKLPIANAGPPRSEAAQKQLFEPFVRGSVKPNQQGLGLGLYIASEIARAHGGTIAVSSIPTLTEFTVSLPLTGGLPVQP
jgi:sigma-B regulation protein RsbU (phosphoserine phosphatase)